MPVCFLPLQLLNKLENIPFSAFIYKKMICVAQVDVPGGRGKPSIIVDKDESLEKVRIFIILFFLVVFMNHEI